MKMSRIAVATFAVIGMSLAGTSLARSTRADVSTCAPDCVRVVPPPRVSAPEIGAGAAGSAIALLVTGMLIAAERARRT
jgi:hypothetical protein